MRILRNLSPVSGTYQRRPIEIPTGVDVLWVHRPFVASRSCEELYGVTGGSTFLERRWRLFGVLVPMPTKIKHEPAYLVLNW